MGIYDVIIVGAGASGLFCSASFPWKIKGLILEKSSRPGNKLMLSGSGQCNLTHSGEIKDFLTRYGTNGKTLRPTLYQFSNHAVMQFFEKSGLPLTAREDGKVFPASMKAGDVLDVLLKRTEANGFQLCCKSEVLSIQYSPRSLLYTIKTDDSTHQTKRLVLACGGFSYPATGSDGSIFSVLKEMEQTAGVRLKKIAPHPALAPVHVQDYPYGELSGLSFPEAGIAIQIKGKSNSQGQAASKREIKTSGALLFTHAGFSGPVILDNSRYVNPGDTLIFNYLPGIPQLDMEKRLKQLLLRNQKQIETTLYDYLNFEASFYGASFSKRFIKLICQRCGIDPAVKSATLSGADARELIHLMTEDRFSISGTGGYNTAMVTAGGVSLEEIDLKTMECGKYPGLYIIGEMLDVDGDTGGFNFQFAFSSGYAACSEISKRLL